MRNILILALGLTCTLSACTAYRPDIQQGNVLEAKQLAKLKVGMNKKQVSFLLGSPLLQDPFHRDQWDYIYTLQKPDAPQVRQRLTLFFQNDVLVRIDDSEMPKNPDTKIP